MRARNAVVVFVLAGASTVAAQQPAAPAGAAPSVATLLNQAAQRNSDISEELKKARSAMVDLSVPDSPAFTVLGLAPEEISRPTNARQLATSLLNGVDRSGVLQSGVAIDTVPYLAIFGRGVRLEQYRDRAAAAGSPGENNYPTRFVSRLQLSVATSKATSETDKAIRAALGLRFTLLDFGDPRTDKGLEKCFDQDLPPLPPPPASLAPEAQVTRLANVEAYLTRLAAAAEKCRQNARQETWNNSKWIVAYAPAGKSDSGGYGDLKGDGYGVWTTLAYGFEGVPGLEDSAQVLVHGRRRMNELVVDPADAAKRIPTNSWLFGVQVRGGGPNASLAVEALFDRKAPNGGVAKTDQRVSLAYEHRIAPNLWLGIALGGQAPKADGTKAGSFLLSSLKWGFAEGPSLSPAPGQN